MSAQLIVVIVVGWFILCAMVLVSMAMLSARISRIEESSQQGLIIKRTQSPVTAPSASRIPTQPRA